MGRDAIGLAAKWAQRQTHKVLIHTYSEWFGYYTISTCCSVPKYRRPEGHQLLADMIPTHSTSLSHNMHHYCSSTHMLYTHYSPLVQPSLLVMSLIKDPPPLAYLRIPLTLHQKLSNMSQCTHQTQVPAHLCSSANRGTVSHKCSLSMHGTRYACLLYSSCNRPLTTSAHLLLVHLI